MDKRKVIKTLVDTDTGECIEIRDGDVMRINSPAKQEAMKKSYNTKELNKDIEEWNKSLGGFVFVLFKYSKDIMEKHSEITSEDITKLFYLATYVDYEGYLVFENTYMSRNTMSSLLKTTRKTFDLFYNKMKRLNVFTQDKNNIKINSEYFCRGRIDKEIKQYYDYTRLYIDTIRYLFENVPQRQHRQLGNYLKMIPYIHRQQNVLSYNPDGNSKEMHLMHVKDLKDILGYTTKGIKGFITDLLSVRLNTGEAIVGFFRTEYDEGKSFIVVNPKVFYGGNFGLKDGRNAIIKWFGKQ